MYSNAKERRKWDKLSEFFAIIKTTEHLENARIKSAIGRDEVLPLLFLSYHALVLYGRTMLICCLAWLGTPSSAAAGGNILYS